MSCATKHINIAAAPTIAQLCSDLALEHEALDAILAQVPAESWSTRTPAEGWDVKDEVGHLAYFDEAAVKAVTAPAAFRAHFELVGNPIPDQEARARALDATETLEWWRSGTERVREVMSGLDPRARVPWYGPDMGATSFVTARLMETWAHGQDIVDALGIEREPSARLRHVAHMGVATIAFCHGLNGLEPPSDPIRVELAAPGGASWEWGPAEAANLVRGPALDFCLVVTRRRHLADSALEVKGDAASRWMSIAQAFAGPPGSGREPGQFPKKV